MQPRTCATTSLETLESPWRIKAYFYIKDRVRTLLRSRAKRFYVRLGYEEILTRQQDRKSEGYQSTIERLLNFVAIHLFLDYESTRMAYEKNIVLSPLGYRVTDSHRI